MWSAQRDLNAHPSGPDRELYQVELYADGSGGRIQTIVSRVKAARPIARRLRNLVATGGLEPPRPAYETRLLARERISSLAGSCSTLELWPHTATQLR